MREQEMKKAVNWVLSGDHIDEIDRRIGFLQRHARTMAEAEYDPNEPHYAGVKDALSYLEVSGYNA